MICDVEAKEIEDISVSDTPTQTTFWARVKNDQGFIPNGFHFAVSSDLLTPMGDNADKKEDDLLVLVKYLNNHQCYAYVPYGPEIEPDFENYGVFLEELSEVLRSYLPKDCIYIKYDLPWASQWTGEDEYYDDSGNWHGPPGSTTQELRLNFKTRHWNLQKSPSDVLPVNTIILNLQYKEKELLAGMKPKTRYNIGYSFRRGVKVREYGPGMIDEWYRLYKETAVRNNLTLHHKDYFKTLFSNNEETDEGVKVSLLMADYEGVFLAAMILVLSGDRATYLYGASSSERRNLMATYAVQWEAINMAQSFNCTEYDMFGTAPNGNRSHPMHGLHRYKKGFGGSLFHRMGCWDYPYLTADYKILKAQEVNNQSYRLQH